MVASLLARLAAELAAVDDNQGAADAFQSAYEIFIELGDDLAAATIVPGLVEVRHQLGAGLDERTTMLRGALQLIAFRCDDAAQEARASIHAGPAAANMLDRRLASLNQSRTPFGLRQKGHSYRSIHVCTIFAMMASGDSPVLLILLAALIASTGYAGGRIHQWYRMGRDRDEAYRDGYDTATRSVFSLAARVISPRRADRAVIGASAAVVVPPAAVVSSETPVPAGISQPRNASNALSSAGSAGSVGAEAFSGPSGPVPSGVPTGSAVPSVSARNAPSAFFSAPASAGRAPSSPSAARDCEPDSAESSGRHTVPDELVRAATYRLAADRVARAKVRGQVSPIASPRADPPPRPAVPKPRGS